MRRLCNFVLVLSCLITLAACGQESGGETTADINSLPPSGGSGIILQNIDGLEIALPEKYLDLLRIDTDFPDAEESWKPLISIYEKSSYEAAIKEYGGGGGFLFGFLVMDQAAFEQFINADGSGIQVFATDGKRYYAYTYPTDVQFCRPGGEINSESEEWKKWEELNEIGPAVREDFLSRNSLQPFTVEDFINRLSSENRSYLCLKYSSRLPDGGTASPHYTLFLRQPVKQGEGGIWAVEQWLDEWGNQYLYFPDSGKPAAEYYAGLQEACDSGDHQSLLSPTGAAAAFMKDFFGYEAGENSFEEIPETVPSAFAAADE